MTDHELGIGRRRTAGPMTAGLLDPDAGPRWIPGADTGFLPGMGAQ